MSGAGRPPEALLAARRALDGQEGVTLLEDWQWLVRAGKWALRCRLQVEVPPGSRVPAESSWYVLASPRYPAGDVSVWPDKEGGVTETFPHQGHNAPGDPALPFRTGWLCLKESLGGWRPQGREPRDADGRLLWYVERARAWLHAAARDELLRPGEPTWLPLLPDEAQICQLLYSEGPEHLAGWYSHQERVHLVGLRRQLFSGLLVMSEVYDRSGQRQSERRWGSDMSMLSEPPRQALLVRLDELPVLPPYRWPRTWRELRQAFSEQGVSLEEVLRRGYLALRGEVLLVLLLAVPLPRLIGERPDRMHLFALHLPLTGPLAQEQEEAWWRRQRNETIAADTALRWMGASNWHPAVIGARGRLAEKVTQRRMLLVGAGSVGSILAEMLVRAGLQDLVLMDGDHLEIGNLVRHTATQDQLPLFKAAAVMGRLNLSSPHARTSACCEHFPPSTSQGRDLAQQCDLVLDLTGEDAVVSQLAEFPWEGERLFLSFSLGAGARRLFCYAAYGRTFPAEDFHQQLRPWLEHERAEPGEALDEVGCHDPFFRARVDEVWLMAALAVPMIERWATSPPREPILQVIERPEPRVAVLPGPGGGSGSTPSAR